MNRERAIEVVRHIPVSIFEREALQTLIPELKNNTGDMKEAFWKKKLTPFDSELCKMVESLTEKPCEPKNGGNHYFFEVDYENHNDPVYILAIWDAIEGRTGDRLIGINDDAERHALMVRVKFYNDGCPDAAFIPKIEQETENKDGE